VAGPSPDGWEGIWIPFRFFGAFVPSCLTSNSEFGDRTQAPIETPVNASERHRARPRSHAIFTCWVEEPHESETLFLLVFLVFLVFLEVQSRIRTLDSSWRSWRSWRLNSGFPGAELLDFREPTAILMHAKTNI